MPDVKFLGLHHVSLNVSDLERAAAFYAQLDLEPIPGANARVRWFRLGRNELHLILTEKPIPRCLEESDYHLALEVDDIQQAAQSLVAVGGEILQEPRQRPHDGSWYLFALDLDGNRLELTQHAPDWHLRNALVDNLANTGSVRQARVESALRAVPRHLFLPNHSLSEAYKDDAIMTKHEGEAMSSSSQPAIVAIMLEQLGLHRGQRVLEIGAGTGWNAALMAHLVGSQGHITTVDIDADTVAFARENLTRASVANVEVIHADGGFGYASGAPYDAVIATVGLAEISPHWFEQLREGGCFVAPLWFNNLQFCGAFRKQSGQLISHSFHHCGFMPLRGEFAGARAQVSDDGLYLQFDKGIPVDVAALRELFKTPSCEVCVRALQGEDGAHFIDYMALRGEPIMQVHLPALTGPLNVFALLQPHTSLALFQPGKVIQVFGDKATLWHLQKLVAQWGAAGRPGLKQARMVVAPLAKSPTATTPTEAFVLRKQWMEYHISFVTNNVQP